MAGTRTGQLNNTETAAFCSQLALMVRAGLPLSEGLHLMMEDSGLEEYQILASIVAETDQGADISAAFDKAGVFPDYMVNMISLGESSGRLDEVLEALARYYRREADIRDSLRSALTYPMIMIVMVFIISGVIVAKVMPIFAQVFNQLGSDLSGIGRFLLAAGTAIGKYSTVIIAVMLIAAIAIYVSYRRDSGRTIMTKLGRIPAIGRINQSAATCRFADGMALTLSSGLSPERCLELTLPLMEDEASRSKLTSCIERVANGTDMYQAMVDAKLISGLNSRLAAIGHRTGQMDQCMEEISALAQKELDENISGLLAILEPALVIIISTIVGAILLSVMLPLVGIMSVI